MKPEFRTVGAGNPLACEISKRFLELAVKIASCIYDDFQSSDFHEITGITYGDLDRFLELLQCLQKQFSSDHEAMTACLEHAEIHVLARVFWYARNFGDDISELKDFHDKVCEMGFPLDPVASSAGDGAC